MLAGFLKRPHSAKSEGFFNMSKVIRKKGDGADKLKKLREALKTDKKGKVGWFDNARYEDGTPVAYVAAIHEFGSPQNKILPRPFMRTTIKERRQSWQDIAMQGAKAILNGKATPELVLEGIGQQAAGDIRKTISKIQTPSLKPATVKARLRRRANKRTVGNLTKPLVDTGYLLATVENKVE